MTISEFNEYTKEGKALNTQELVSFMYEMSEKARMLTFKLNNSYHTAEETRAILS